MDPRIGREMARPDFIVSDIHLGAVPRETERAFVEFLEHVGSEGRSLLIVGDLFDFWFEYGSMINGKQFRVLAALSELVDSGMAVTLMGGNHDAWGGSFLREEVGVGFYPDQLRMELGGRSALVTHGDGVGAGDLKYRLLRSVLRSRFTVGAFRLLHPEVGQWLAGLASSTESKVGNDLAAAGRASHIEEWARTRLMEEPDLELVVCGHSHLPAVLEVEAGRYYLNAGDWIQRSTYITIAVGSRPELKSW